LVPPGIPICWSAGCSRKGYASSLRYRPGIRKNPLAVNFNQQCFCPAQDAYSRDQQTG
jgi:hypothetical protein